MSRQRFAGVAWPYANGPRHIGHVAGFGVPSDIFSRYHRMAGNRVLMVSGTDEHGTPITVAADKEGVPARQIADRYSRVIAEGKIRHPDHKTIVLPFWHRVAMNIENRVENVVFLD